MTDQLGPSTALGLVAHFDSGLPCDDSLERQGKRHTILCQHLVGSLQERKRPANPQASGSLIDQLLEFHGSYTAARGAGHHGPERIQALTAQQRGQDGERAILSSSLLSRSTSSKAKLEKRTENSRSNSASPKGSWPNCFPRHCFASADSSIKTPPNDCRIPVS